MSEIGSNTRLTVAHEHRAALARMFTEALGCQVMRPPGAKDMEVFVFGRGGVGAYYVDGDAALRTVGRDAGRFALRTFEQRAVDYHGGRRSRATPARRSRRRHAR